VAIRSRLRSRWRHLSGYATNQASEIESVETRTLTGTDRGLLRSVLDPRSPVPNTRRLGHPFQWKNPLPWHLGPPPNSESSTSRIVGHSGITVAFKTTFEVFTRTSPNNSLERLTERSVGLVTDRPSNVYELIVTLLQ
jgi:hypothetical protein